MDVSALSAAQPQRSTNAFSQLTGNIDTFLTLLTAQLRNQDPLDPLDTEKFTSQLVQFASVEQSIQTNSNLETLIRLQASADREGALAMIGKTAFIASDKAANAGAGATWSYNLPQGAMATRLAIVDQSGRAVAMAPGAAAAGEHLFAWDGKLADGSPAPAGVYRLVVNAVDAVGATQPTEVRAAMAIFGVEFGADGPMLETAIGPIALDGVKRVTAPTLGR